MFYSKGSEMNVNFKIDDLDLWRRFKAITAREGSSIRAVIMKLIIEYIEKKEEERKAKENI
jgi:hypothetical protein